MLMTTPYLEQTVRDYVRTGALPIGVHLSLTLGRAVAHADQVPALVDESGNLKLSARRLIFASFGSGDGRLLREVRRELKAQLALALDCGIRPTHADSHQHVHMNPAIFAIIEDLLPHYGIERIRYCRERFVLPALGGDLPAVIRALNAAKWLALRWRTRQVRPRLLTNDEFFGVLCSGVMSKQVLESLIALAPREAATEICIHPGFVAPKEDASYPQPNYNRFISSVARRTEHDILVEPAIDTLVRERGLVLRSFDGRVKPGLA
jgi:predicted glycoside hydrolase/deacetylase ChbG (UPF0249 family)